MSVLIYIRFIVGVICILASTVFFIIEVMGVFRMNYILNRMHLAAVGDALALSLSFIGLILLCGLNFTSFKLFLIPCFMFLSSPVSSHLIAQMEVETSKQTNRFRTENVEDINAGKMEEDD